jgi:hypothetical protein
MTTGLDQGELIAMALATLRQQPGCSEIRRLGIYGLREAQPGERNWEISNVDCTVTPLNTIQRGVIAVHYQLGRKYHLIMD